MEKQNYNINESEQIKNNQSEQIEENQSEQIEYCKVCGKPITKRFNFWDKKSRLVRCRCDCDEKAEQEIALAIRQCGVGILTMMMVEILKWKLHKNTF